MRRCIGLVFVTVGLALSQSQNGQPKAPKLWAAISTPQPIFSKADAQRMQLYFGVFNDGNSTANPHFESSHLLINGVEPRDWLLVIGNGLHSEFFIALPPGRALQFSYQLGPRYFNNLEFTPCAGKARILSRRS